MPSWSVTNLPAAGEGARVGGARADFVAHLGKRVVELRHGVNALEADPKSARVRDELRRRVHALASASRILKFHAMAEHLAAAEDVLAKVASGAAPTADDIAELRGAIEALPSLAWGDAADVSATAVLPATKADEGERSRLAFPATALVVGAITLADALTSDIGAASDAPLECERTDDASTAVDLARALAPDVVLLDADVPGAEVVAQRLLRDPLTEPVPIVVIGTLPTADLVARWVALGAARVLPKPASPASIQAAVNGAIAARTRAERPDPVGETTIEELADRLANEVRRGLVEATAKEARDVVFDVGDGHEVLAAIWSAVSRIREIATIRSHGTIRFANVGPEGAVPIASFAGEARGEAGREGAAPAKELSLDGRVVVIADDDPAVTWFIASVLRAAGATVLEAHDGDGALALAYRASPDVVISDVLMPNVDGFSLCRALKRDVALRDVPVILLSWKEDLLQRVRELGGGADGYLRKEASGAVLLQRVREVLRPRLRVEARLSGAGEVRGRLDGLTVRTLLQVVSKLRPDARVAIRDASFLYEIELREGHPRTATRTASDGSFERGEAVFASVLGASAGRFAVTAPEGPVRPTLDGTLAEQLRKPIARARAAQKLLSGASLLSVERVEIDLLRIETYLAASPDASRAIATKLAEGMAPKQMLLRGGVGARLLEDVLADAAAHGAVLRVLDAEGDDLLAAASARELSVLERGLTKSLIPPPREVPASVALVTPSPLAPFPKGNSPVPEEVAAPKTPAPPSPEPSSPSPPTIAALTPSAPPERDSEHEPSTTTAPALLKGTTPSPMEEALLSLPAVTTAEPAPDARAVVEATPLGAADEIPDSKPTPAPSPPPPDESREATTAPAGKPKTQPKRETRAAAPSKREPPKKTSSNGLWALVTFLLIATVTGLFAFGRTSAPEEPTPTPKAATSVTSARTASASGPVASSPSATPSASAGDDDLGSIQAMPEMLPLARGDSVPDGYGMLEVVAGSLDDVLVDRLEVGRGPRVKVPLTPGSHDVRARRRGEEQPVVVVIRAGRRTRVDLRAPWKR